MREVPATASAAFDEIIHRVPDRVGKRLRSMQPGAPESMESLKQWVAYAFALACELEDTSERLTIAIRDKETNRSGVVKMFRERLSWHQVSQASNVLSRFTGVQVPHLSGELTEASSRATSRWSARARQRASPTAGIRLLIVEPVAADRVSLSEQCNLCGYIVHTAESCEEALLIVRLLVLLLRDPQIHCASAL